MAPILDEFFSRCRAHVIANNGIVDKVMGDEIMALFNVPMPIEDHISRAVTTASSIQIEAAQFNKERGESGLVRVGIGISSGLAYTSNAGSDSCNDYTAIGDAINMASRLQSQAAPGQILVSPEVHSTVNEAFPNSKEVFLDLKGIDKPVRAFYLT